MIRDTNKEKAEKNIKAKLDSFLKGTDPNCTSEECLINNPEEIVKRENKKIITGDGRQLLSEYTQR
jgi:hypothetical protein